jgi:membrane-associated phospholipid phosphatase
MKLRKITASLHTSDVLLIGFAALLTVINIVFSARIAHWSLLVLINVVAIVLICVLAYSRHALGWKSLQYLHDWYVPFVVFFSFKELYFMIKPLHLGKDYDDWLIAVDRWLFGVDPTEWIMQFANPVTTEVLQIAYTSFYFLFLILGYELYRRGDMDVFHYFVFTCVYGFFLSYMGYFFLPAVGPRFTLHDFSALDQELPGLLLTPYLRWFVNAGGSVPMGVPNDVALAGTQRDVFPSGHTMMTLVLIYLSAKYKVRVRHFIYVTGALLIVATVYHRYHYVIDIIAGALLMVFCVATSPHLYSYIKHRFKTIESRLTST